MPPTPQSCTPRAAPLCVTPFCCPVKKHPISPRQSGCCQNYSTWCTQGVSMSAGFSSRNGFRSLPYRLLWSLRDASSHVPMMCLQSDNSALFQRCRQEDKPRLSGRIYQRTKYLSLFFSWCTSHMFALLLAGHKVDCHFFKCHVSTFLWLLQVFQA